MRSHYRTVLAALAITILALGTVAPFADAGHAYGRRHKQKGGSYYGGTRVVRVVRSYPSGGYYYRRSSSAGPALAGFIGGLIVGAVLTDRASGHAYYRDPYCDRDFYSRDAFYDHCNTYHHTREVRVVRYTDTRRYYDDCNNRGYYDSGYDDRDYRDYRGRDYDD